MNIQHLTRRSGLTTAKGAYNVYGKSSNHEAFLEKVRTRNVNLTPGADTALSPQTSEKKRKEISRRLDRMARDLGDDRLEVGPVKTDGDLAAVLVRKAGTFDPTRLQVFPVALIKRGAAWTAAPVPASFENSGVGYAATLRTRLASLEEWMLRGQVLDLQQLREQSTSRMRATIEASLPASTLRGMDAVQVAERFLSACENRNLPEIFGLLGGLTDPLPGDWPIRLKHADAAISAGNEVRLPWRLLISKDVLRAVVREDGDDSSATVSIACLDPVSTSSPASAPHIEVLNLELLKSPDGLWRIDPPQRFLEDDVTDSSGDDPENADADLVGLFSEKISASFPPSPKGDPKELERTLVAALQDSAMRTVLPCVYFGEDPGIATASCISAAHAWWTLHDPSALRRAIPLATHESGIRAATVFQFFSAKNPLRLELQTFYYQKTAGGWLWSPKPEEETIALFRDWSDSEARRWKTGWQANLLADCPVMEQVPDAPAPNEEEARQVVSRWLASASALDPTVALKSTTRLHSADSIPTLLRNLGYELTGARQSKEPATIIGVYRGGRWTAVGVRSEAYGKASFPLYPVIQTPAGPRILLEIDIVVSGNRSRDFLNKAALERLAEIHPSSAGELRELLEDHQKAASGYVKP